MSVDYSDKKEWKLDTAGEEYLSRYRTFSLQEVIDILTKLLNEAKEKGFVGTYIEFDSTMEPYEDFTGDPTVTVFGYRRKTDKEKKEEEKALETRKLAKEKGISYYEAVELKRLVDKGVVKL